MTVDLIPWLRSVLDDRERKALAAKAEIAAWGGSWTAYTDQLAHRSTIDADAIADHIAEHDPTGVLVEVDAKRRILALHDEQHDCDGDPRSYADPYEGCRTLRLLALPYADRPGYREEWKP